MVNQPRLIKPRPLRRPRGFGGSV